MISPGPRGQSKLTTGRPLLIASTMTMPKPSKRELEHERRPSASASPRSRVAPMRKHLVGQPGSRTWRSSAARSVPAAVDPQLPVGLRGGDRLPRLDQQVEALLGELSRPAATTTLRVRPRALAAERRAPRWGCARRASRRRARPRSRAGRPRSARRARRGRGSGGGRRAASPGRWRLKFMCSWPTVTTPVGRERGRRAG